ncbi:acetyl-CoA carboxylase biotin carboxylase subunit [Arthrobacter sp. MYb229]|uniref:acetyl-CoA carboxylase biotin carboxylase subunit n=1 Tax=unclassified Arthrobacter TaxID=235627 RepID=UPI000CFAAE63|nr:MULTISPECIES: acetyl-CoA carboxylase biotin carboxylase subunit [unclassified Arthrobacter]PRA07103.1 acetyl-CoA carboxylase biotin carboxylase subunit [Arthrobacter sp. MYb229]PRB47941.1 acetyl-CoA carboxylase biotin carboxylase subunit [Arthrobacter sp. MYb216]
MKRVLVANRGEIAVRIIRACRQLGLETVAIYSEADADLLHVRLADKAVKVGPSHPGQSYLRGDVIVQIALSTGADAIHPGYGFLAENAQFARMCQEENIIFIGPSEQIISKLGDKVYGRGIATTAGVPVVAGSGDDNVSEADVHALGQSAGYPVLLKAAAGGGGRGMRIVREPNQVKAELEDARREALASFGSDVILAEQFLERIRHVEVQILGDHHGNVMHVGTRDCTVQRRYQKVLEEGPANAISDELRSRIEDDAVRLVSKLHYVGAGTVEFVVDLERNTHHFIEMNTRIQVEHPVTEMLSGLDLVREQLWVADPANELSFTQQQVQVRGAAIELRINAEDPDRNFQPMPGRITALTLPGGPGVRIDTHCQVGTLISPFYDSMIAKLIVHDRDRPSAISRAIAALEEMKIDGVTTNIEFLQRVLRHEDFQHNDISTRWLEHQREELMPVLETAGR